MTRKRPIPRISLPQLRDAEGRMQINRTSTYHKVYREFLRFFRECGRIDAHVFILGANMAYGWMPTILVLNGDEFSEVAALLDRARTGGRLSPGELEKVKCTVKNSVVGASKLLHFVNPNSYPIWDRRVCAFINSGRENRHRKAQVNKVSDYMSYVDNCGELVDQEGFRVIHQSVNAKIDYEVSAYRAVELVMYEGGKALPPTMSTL